jgi:hypothetical protein
MLVGTAASLRERRFISGRLGDPNHSKESLVKTPNPVFQRTDPYNWL